MNNLPQNSQIELDEAEVREIMRSLLHKEGSWVEWGKKCQTLQKAGYEPAKIFEDTGFQASQQNLIIVASQVYDSIAQAQLDEAILEYFKGPRSDVLYEFRILNQSQRAAASQLAYDKKIDVDGAHLVAKAMQDVAHMSQIPEAFTNCPGDNVAYLCWKRARRKRDLQERSRLIAQGLKFAQSQSAREAIEKLLSDFSVEAPVNAPLLPIYRLEVEEQLPRIIPLAGTYPLTRQTLDAVAPVKTQESFSSITVSGGTFVPVPGWQAVLKAIDPVAYLCPSDRLPKSIAGKVREFLVILDRGSQEWDVNSYFVVEVNGQIEIKWFDTAPNIPIVGQLVLILRPKKILDENNIIEPWQMDD
jgi:Rubisco Assembly chaperone C-terminal domain/Rubisco accumulation factor 1 alpha helical domain/Rubisco accumulation factor 1 helix turn helix domain